MTGSPAADLDTAAAVLEFARARGRRGRPAEAEKLQAAVTWAAMHSVDSLDQAATVWDHGETGLPVAGPGAPLVAEFSVTEFAAAIGLPTEAGKAYLGEAVELRYRLRRIWSRVIKGDLPAWRARRVARATMVLSMEAAAYVDLHVAHVAHKVRPAQLDRLVEEAIGRFMPEEAERRRRQAADGRSFTVDTRQPSLRGTSTVYGELDLADALDLDAAVAAGAQALKDLGSTDTLDVRRATAVGDLARRQLTLDLNPTPDADPDADDDRRTGDATTPAEPDRDARGVATRKPRQVVMYVHLSDAAVTPGAPLAGEFGRVENTRGPVHAEQIRQWCGNPDAQITVQPVIDLNEHIDVEAYEIRGRLREQTILTHPTCVFPWCTRPARALEPDEHDADCDHRVPYAVVKHSCSCNAAPLCRRHHRAKTHGRLDLHRPRPRHLCVDQPAPVPVPARRPRHPRRLPRPTPPPAGPLHPPPAAGPRHPPAGSRHPPAGPLTPPPRTPPDHHRRGHRHVRTRTSAGFDRLE